jgi:curved DNA-binding protein CbpA
MRDLYEVLGLGSDAAQKQIKAAFHRLAKESHPDLNAGDPTAEKRFKELTQAYEILGDPESRAAYDLGLEQKRAKVHGRMRDAMATMAVAFLLTIGIGLYFLYPGQRSAPRRDAAELFEMQSPGPQTKRGGPAQGEAAVVVATPSSTPGRQAECDRALRLHVRGLQLIEMGEVSAARSFLERAADAGICKSAWELARTYDPVELSKLKIIGLQPDVRAAREWRDRARDLCGTPQLICEAADVELAHFRAAYTSGNGLAYVVIHDGKAEHVYRYGDESRLAAKQDLGEYKLFKCNTPHLFSPRLAEHKTALLNATVVKSGDARFAELDAKYVSSCNNLVPTAIVKR